MERRSAVFVWGLGQSMELGNKEKKSEILPFRIKELDDKGVVAVSTGNYFTVALTKGGDVFGWGNAKHARFGVEGQMIVSPVQIKSLKKIKMVSAGNWHTMAVDETGIAYGSGHNNYGALGMGHLQRVQGFQPVPLLKEVIQVSCGDGTTLFLVANGTCYTCGHRMRNGLGRKDHESAVKQLMQDVKAINAGYTHSAIITKKGQTYVFGDNTFLQLGLGKGVKESLKPHLVQELVDVNMAQISCSRGEKNAHTCATDTEGRIYTWGSGYKGKLGHYAKWTHEDPADEPLPKKLTTIDVRMSKSIAGGIHSCFLSVDGQVYSCGCGSDGRLGHPQSAKYTYLYREGIPRLVEAFKGMTVVSLSSSYKHNAAVALL